MSRSTISDKLPSAIISKLVACDGVGFRVGSSMNVIRIVDSIEAQEVYRSFLMADAEEVDPLLSPGFGHPLFPY